MAHLWVQGAFGQPLKAAARPRNHDPAAASVRPRQPGSQLGPRGEMDRLAIRFSRGRDAPSWHLCTLDGNVCVNGTPVRYFRELRDRDVIDVPGEGVLIFAAETPPLVERFPGPVEPSASTCARCGSAMEGHARAVACPACEAWHHQSRKERCWTAQPGCANCGYPTDLRAGFLWRP